MYSKIFSWLRTPQSEPIPGRGTGLNDAGGYGFAVDDWTRLDRFLILGAEGGTYYVGERRLTRENAEAVIRCLAADGARVVARIVAVSEAGRAPKNDPAIFALAMAAGLGDEATRRLALSALPRVCRTASHLFRFAAEVEGFRGWGRGLRRAVAEWYRTMPLDRLVLQALKYRARGEAGQRWSHRDLLRLSHPALPAEDTARRALFDRLCRPDGSDPLPAELAQFAAAEALSRTAEVETACRLIARHRLPREAVPTELLNSPAVWRALLPDMPMTALLRALAKLSATGVLAPRSEAEELVVARLADRERLRRARVHPLQILVAQATYAQGRGLRGGLSWEPSPRIVDALNRAFYESFGLVEPSGKRLLLALDVSGSMGWGQVAGSPLTPRVAAAAMALVTLAVERRAHVVAFSDRMVPLTISPGQRLDDVCAMTSSLSFGATDCAQPMLYALERELKVDAFVVYTDSETWAGNIHPVQALDAYRRRMGLPARLAVVGMTSTGFSIADPADGGMLDVVGFDGATPQLLTDFVSGRI
ncbi:MAG: 60 kDa SS-A/Ro ribonucleoprotein [Alphaproteobacteria bacterium]|nr:MAG: 60 kDa SS-A/Ro ribonucleoprotein [Alphaproteobacteria bacterium]